MPNDGRDLTSALMSFLDKLDKTYKVENLKELWDKYPEEWRSYARFHLYPEQTSHNSLLQRPCWKRDDK